MENVAKTVSVETLGQILSVGAILSTSTEATSTSTEATATAQPIVATVSHVVATEEVREACTVAIAIDETVIEGELSTVWAELRNNEVNLNELFSTELSIVNGCLSIAIAPRVATV